MQTNNKYDIKFICEDSEREENATTVVGAVEFSFSFATLIKVLANQTKSEADYTEASSSDDSYNVDMRESEASYTEKENEDEDQESDYELDESVEIDQSPTNGSRCQWTPKQDKTLYRALKKYGKRWTKIKESLPDKSINNLRCRAEKLFQLNPSLSSQAKKLRSNWTYAEDMYLIELIEIYGENNWKTIGKKMKSRYYNRDADKCRSRWRDQLKMTAVSNNRKHNWTQQEDETLLRGYRLYTHGNGTADWAKIHDMLPQPRGYHNVRNRLKSLALRERVVAIDNANN